MSIYKPDEFWEKSHASVPSTDVDLGSGIHHVGGGQSELEAKALYQLRQVNARRILRKCNLPPHPKIFELGSGGGYWANFFGMLNPALFLGSDLSSTAVARLNSQFPDCGFVCLGDAETAWQDIKKQGPYDLCLGIDVLYHIVDDSAWAFALNNLCENCKPGGWLLLADYFYEQPREIPSRSHVKHRSVQSYLNVLEEYGFQVIHIQPIFFFLNRIVSGPWKDHTPLTAAFLKIMTSNKFGLSLLSGLDSIITRFGRPLSPKSKTRFLLARKSDDAK